MHYIMYISKQSPLPQTFLQFCLLMVQTQKLSLSSNEKLGLNMALFHLSVPVIYANGPVMDNT